MMRIRPYLVPAAKRVFPQHLVDADGLAGQVAGEGGR